MSRWSQEFSIISSLWKLDRHLRAGELEQSFTRPDLAHFKGQRGLRQGSGSDMSDSSYLSYQVSDGFPGTRQSSINTEPLTLDDEEIGNAKGEAEQVLESVDPEEAVNIFTKDLQIQNGAATTEEEMAKQMASHFDDLVQKAAKIVEANQKQAKATSTIPGAPNEELPEGKQHEHVQ